MMVVDRRRWHRTKIGAAVILFIVALACAGGFETTDATKPMPSFGGFMLAMFLLTLLVINIVKEQERL